MNDRPQPSILERSSLVCFFRSLCSWRGLRRIVIVLAWTATIIALLYGEENWRGRRTWNNYRQELEARGAQLDLKAFIPPAVPDEQNFAAIPFIESWFLERTNLDKRWEDNYSRINNQVYTIPAPNKNKRRFVNLVAWQMGLDALRAGPLKTDRRFECGQLDLASRAKAAPTVLEGWKTSEKNLAELRAASHRPFSRYPVVYDLENPWGILLPHLANVKAACVRLQIKACAELALGQSDSALEDVKLMLFLTDSVKDESFVISYVVRVACLQIALQPIWEGLAEHRWSDTQLEELQKRLQTYDLIGDVKRPMEGERAAGTLTAELLFQHKYRLSDILEQPGSNTPTSTFADVLGRMAPHGWYHQEQFNYCRLYESQLAGTYDPAKKRVFPSQIQTRARELEKEIAGGRLGRAPKAVLHHQLLATAMLPALGKIPLKGAMGQTAADQAALACALERYRLSNGQFPETLQALAPKFISQLPADLLSGEPYKYRRTPEGQFVLYSIGWDEKDDGGVAGKTLFDENSGDWVWQPL